MEMAELSSVLNDLLPKYVWVPNCAEGGVDARFLSPLCHSSLKKVRMVFDDDTMRAHFHSTLNAKWTEHEVACVEDAIRSAHRTCGVVKKLITIPPEHIDINSLKEHPSPCTQDVGIMSIPEEKRC